MAQENVFPRLSAPIQTGSGAIYDLVGGLTKRELFAAMAMQGLLSGSLRPDNLTRAQDGLTLGMVKASTELADALLKELAKEK